MEFYANLQRIFCQLIKDSGLFRERIRVKAYPLTPEEAIGNPEERDYPLVKGRERLMEADLRGAKGQAYTDLFGDFEGSLQEIAELRLRNNFFRAVFISSLNALLRHLGLIKGTIHCKDREPKLCGEELVEFIRRRWGRPRVALIGLQPRMAEALGKEFPLRISDMDEENLGKEIGGVLVEGPEKNGELLEWCDLAVITGTVLTNGTVEGVLSSKPTLFYGVTVAGAAHLLGWERFCPFAH